MAAQRVVLKPREVETLLKALGFEMVRQKGSRRQYRHLDGRGTTVPFHPGVATCRITATAFAGMTARTSGF